jgi:hypothetical protein
MPCRWTTFSKSCTATDRVERASFRQETEQIPTLPIHGQRACTKTQSCNRYEDGFGSSEPVRLTTSTSCLQFRSGPTLLAHVGTLYLGVSEKMAGARR